jgi:two-component system response regulator FixJ
MANEPSVFVVDDDEAIRDSLRALMEAEGLAVETFASGREFLDAQTGGSGCLLLDVQMPDMDGLELLGALAARGAAPPVIMITGHADVPLAVKAMQAGAMDFIEKPFTDTAILDGVHQALDRGERVRQKQTFAAQAQAGIAQLSARERQVLEQLVIGRPNKMIAYELGISARTVEIHRARVMEKMGARNLSHLVRMALALGIDPEMN